MEEFKDIKGYKGLYKVSNYGRVISFHKDVKEMKIHINSKRHGYRSVALSKNGVTKRFKLHRLVAEHFRINMLNKPQVNHKDGDVSNNNISNLEWCTDSENKKHRYRVLNSSPTRARMKSVLAYRDGNLIGEFDSVREAARETFSDSSAVSKVCKGKYKQTNGIVFKYNR